MKTDDELRALVAEKVAGLLSPFAKSREWEERSGDDGYDGFFDVVRDANGARVPDYPHDANAVLPLLEKFKHADIGMDFDYGQLWSVGLYNRAGINEAIWIGQANTFARAACLALLRAKGINV